MASPFAGLITKFQGLPVASRGREDLRRFLVLRGIDPETRPTVSSGGTKTNGSQGNKQSFAEFQGRFGERPTFKAPRFDERRLQSLTRRFAAPGEARIQRGLQQGLISTRRDNPNLQAKLQEGLITGFGDASAANFAQAQRGGFQQSNVELGLQGEEARANFNAAINERSLLQRQLFEAEQAGDERAFREALIRLQGVETRLTQSQAISAQTGRDATQGDLQERLALIGRAPGAAFLPINAGPGAARNQPGLLKASGFF